MNCAASHPTARMVIPGVVQRGRFLKEEGWGKVAIKKRNERVSFRP